MMGDGKGTADAEALALKRVSSAGAWGVWGTWGAASPGRGRGVRGTRRAPGTAAPRRECGFGHSLRGGRSGSVLRPLCLVSVGLSWCLKRFLKTPSTVFGVRLLLPEGFRVRGHRGLIRGLRVAGGRDGICFCLGWRPGGMVWGMARGKGFHGPGGQARAEGFLAEPLPIT